MTDERPGYAQVMVTGAAARSTFLDEPGGHRWQRIPPNEKRGRVHTSTVTVAVLDATPQRIVPLRPQDIEVTTTRGSGPGGQHRNKTESCVVATHLPTGTQVRVDNERSQHRNRELAMRILAARVHAGAAEAASAERDSARKRQVGTGMRGDKVRTYRAQDDTVVDHRTGAKMRLSDWVKGSW